MIEPNKYVVLHVVTSGKSVACDDVLRVSLYKPDDGRTFDRFLPLQKRETVGGRVLKANRIRWSDLSGRVPLSQDELDDVIRRFELGRRTILSYRSGHSRNGDGFDQMFMMRYLHDHRLHSPRDLHFFNFRSNVVRSRSLAHGITAEALCRALDIPVASGPRSALDQCRLVWELFKRIGESRVLVTDSQLVRVAPGCLVPASYLDVFPRLGQEVAGDVAPARRECVFERKLSSGASEVVAGCSREYVVDAIGHLLAGMVGAREVDSAAFVAESDAKLERIPYRRPRPGVQATPRHLGLERLANGGVRVPNAAYEEAIRLVEAVGHRRLAGVMREARAEGGSLDPRVFRNPKASSELWAIRMRDANDPVQLAVQALRESSEAAARMTRVGRAVRPEVGKLVGCLRALLGKGEVLARELVVDRGRGAYALPDLSTAEAVVKFVREGADSCALELACAAAGRAAYLVEVGREGRRAVLRVLRA